MNSLVIGLALITSDGLVPELVDGLVLRACADLAVNMEIMDERERRYMFKHEYSTDIKLIHRRYIDFADVPLMVEGVHLPPYEVLASWMVFNRAYRLHINETVDKVNWWHWRQAQLETDDIYYKLNTLRDYQTQYYYVTVRRKALAVLRDKNGGHLYNIDYTPVPLRFFAEVVE